MKYGRIIGASEAIRLAPSGSRIYIAGCLGEPAAILDAAIAEPEAWQDGRITGVYIPGVNDRDLSAIGHRMRVETIFATTGLRPAVSQGRVDLLPMHYSIYEQWVATPGVVDVAYFNVAVPRDDGTVGLGPSADFTPSVLDGGARAIGVINRNLPDVRDGPRLKVDRFEAFVESNAAIAGYESGEPDAVIERIADIICTSLRSGDTIQLGLGKLQTAILKKVKHLRGLGFHGGMLSDAFVEANRAGAFELGVVSGVALGNAAFLENVAEAGNVRFRPVRFTHSIATLAAIPALVSVNSVLEVDLFGQANAEFINDVQISGHGGMVDFVRGARASLDGRSVLALPSTAKGGTVSRIVPTLSGSHPVSVARSDIDVVATEHGMVSLRHAGLEERAEALISIAAPQFRDGLALAWRDRHKILPPREAG